MATIPWAATGQKLEASAEQHCRIWLRTIDSWSEFYCNCLLQTAACCWELCSRESGETSKMMPLPAVKTKTMSWKTLKHWGRRVISHNSSLGAKPTSNSWSFALFGKKVDIWVSLMTPDPTYDPKASVFDKLEWKKTTSYWTFKFSRHAFIKPTSQKKKSTSIGSAGSRGDGERCISDEVFHTSQLFLKRQIGHGFIFIQHSRLCFLTFCVIITVETIGGILPVIFWLVPL